MLTAGVSHNVFQQPAARTKKIQQKMFTNGRHNYCQYHQIQGWDFSIIIIEVY